MYPGAHSGDDGWHWSINGQCANVGIEKVSFFNLERATGIELATSSLGIKITALLFSQLTKPLMKNA
jgi:hypothetical protein